MEGFLRQCLHQVVERGEAVRGELTKPGLASGDDGDFRHGEDAVGDQQGKDDGEFEEDRVYASEIG
jgi:hypothetical protein